MKTNATHAAELKALFKAYVILGGDWWSGDFALKSAEIVAFSVTWYRSSKFRPNGTVI